MCVDTNELFNEKGNGKIIREIVNSNIYDNINPNILILGRDIERRTSIADNLIKNMKNVKKKIVMTSQDKSNIINYYRDAEVIDGYNRDVFIDLIKEQNKNIKGGIIDNIVIVFDDCLCSDMIQHDKIFQEVFNTNKHHHITFIICNSVEYFPPMVRCSFDYIFLLETQKHEKIMLYETFAGIFQTFNIFETVFDKIVDNRCALVFTQNTDYVSFYKYT